MTYPKMKPCPGCGSTNVFLYTYESGWSRVECNACDTIHSCEGTKLLAIREHNAKADCAPPPVIARPVENCPFCGGVKRPGGHSTMCGLYEPLPVTQNHSK